MSRRARGDSESPGSVRENRRVRRDAELASLYVLCWQHHRAAPRGPVVRSRHVSDVGRSVATDGRGRPHPGRQASRPTERSPGTDAPVGSLRSAGRSDPLTPRGSRRRHASMRSMELAFTDTTTPAPWGGSTRGPRRDRRRRHRTHRGGVRGGGWRAAP